VEFREAAGALLFDTATSDSWAHISGDGHHESMSSLDPRLCAVTYPCQAPEHQACHFVRSLAERDLLRVMRGPGVVQRPCPVGPVILTTVEARRMSTGSRHLMAMSAVLATLLHAAHGVIDEVPCKRGWTSTRAVVTECARSAKARFFPQVTSATHRRKRHRQRSRLPTVGKRSQHRGYVPFDPYGSCSSPDERGRRAVLDSRSLMPPDVLPAAVM
jgi:hypothetical protein